MNGQLEYGGDLDTLTFAVTAGRWYSFNINSAPAGSSVALRSGSGSVLASGPTSASFLATTTETCSLQISNTTALGSWSIQESDGVDDAPNSATGAVALTLGVQRAGHIQYSNDEDWYSVTLTAGLPATLNGAYTGSTTVWYVYNADGVTQTPGVGAFFTTKTFTPSVTGTYYLRVYASGPADYTMTASQ